MSEEKNAPVAEPARQAQNAKAMEAIEQELAGPTTPEPQAEEKVELAVKETETLPVEESAPLELEEKVDTEKIEETMEEVVEEETPIEETEDHQISDEDIEQHFKERKTGVQKRIDKLTAEKKSALAEVNELKDRLIRLEQAQQQAMEQPKPEVGDNRPTQYTRHQLETAVNKAVAEQDMALYHEATEHLRKLDIWEAKQEYIQQQSKQTESQRKESLAWNEVVTEYEGVEDSDLQLNNTNSLLFRMTKRLLTDKDEGPKLSRYGTAKYALAVKEAHRLILEMRSKNKNAKQAKSLEKQLAKEKRKNSLTSGGSGVDKAIQKPKAKESEITFDSSMKDMLSNFNKVRGVAS